MNREERERLVDAVLDRALGPQSAEPRPGLEERILANLPNEVERRPWWRWMWVPALAAAAVLAVVIGMRVLQKQQPPLEQVKIVETPKQEAVVKPEAPMVKKQSPQLRAKRKEPSKGAEAPRVVASTATPKQEQFPAPLPLSNEERRLLSLARMNSDEAERLARDQAEDRAETEKWIEAQSKRGIR